MAAVPESMSLYSNSTSDFGMGLSPAITMSSSASFYVRNKLALMPEFRGLRIQIQNRRSMVVLSSRNQTGLRRCASIYCEAQDIAIDIPTVTQATWDSLVLHADRPVLVEFWAPWCGPCRMIHPVIGELSEQYSGKLHCYKLNTDESRSIATQCGIRSVPTTLIFVNGEKKDTIIGAVPKTMLSASIEKFL